MTNVIEYTPEYTAAWTDYVTRADNSLVGHQIAWMEIIRKGLGHVPRYLLSIDRSRVTGILPLFIVKTWWGQKAVISLPWIDYGGVCADDPETEKNLVVEGCRIAREEKASFLELRSIEAGDFGLALRQDKVTFVLDLALGPEKIWEAFDAKLRNQIRKAEKSALTTEYAGIKKLDEFYRIFSRNMRDLGTPVWGRGFFRNILENLSDSARLIIVRKGGSAIAAGLVLSFKDRLYIPSASAYREFLKYCPNHALYWSVIRDACEQGYKYFDFGRSSWHSGTFNFKKQWVPSPTQLTWQYYLHKAGSVPAISPDNPKFRLFINIWRRLPLPVANFLGPKVIRNFP
jgi:serine/alanine adding enzyme